MNIRKCKFEDILALSELEKTCFKSEGYGYTMLASMFENANFSILVAEDGGEIIGYGCAETVCENSDLEKVVVAEAFRKSGVGTAIVNALIEDAKSRGAEKMFLEVRVSNVNALKLYLENGFSGVYARTRYYSDGEDCLVMSRTI